MNKIFSIGIIILLTISFPARASDAYDQFLLPADPYPYIPVDLKKMYPAKSAIQADSIMQFVIDNATRYSRAVSRYQADIYIKGYSEIRKKNILLRFGHHLFPVNRKKPNTIFEMISEAEYVAPNHFIHNFKAVNGNSMPSRKKQEEVVTFLNLNIYAPTIYNEAILSPLGKTAFKHYDFNLENTDDSDEISIYKIRFIPKQWSPKLVSGCLYIREQDWTIQRIEMNGRVEFAVFDLKMSFGHEYGQLILPNKADLNLRYNVLGNSLACSYHSSFDYKSVEWHEIEDETKKKKREWKDLDLTKYFTLQTDSIPVVTDPEYWKEKRDIPLTTEEEEIYKIQYSDELPIEQDTIINPDYMRITEALASTHSFTFPTTRIRYSGILNPFQLGYSSRNGITYRQRLRITKTFPDERQLEFNPEIGFVFKRKEVFFKIRANWHYLPEKLGSLYFTLANDNQSYSSKMMEDINEHLKDSLFNFDDLNLDYYRHYYVDLKNSIELSNGFLLDVGLSYHRRSPVKKKMEVDPGEEVEDIINDTYYDFIPRIGFTYTPRQFYRMIGRKKEYVYSYYPTFSVTFSRGISGVLESSGNYARIEGDIHQSLKVGSLQRLNYHLSGGMYTRMKSVYFAEFDYFTRRNFPDSWDDQIGGVFHLLKREWFNASDKYVQTHFMYETPFLLFNLFNRAAARYILWERIYLGHVWTPALPSYTEMGYGIGNEVFNIAVFVGFNKCDFHRIGVKFSFELGR